LYYSENSLHRKLKYKTALSMASSKKTKDSRPTALDFLNRLALSSSEKSVAQLVAADPAKAMNLSMAQLATSAGVSEPTVARFCQSAGFEGFKEFRLWLAHTVGSNTAIQAGTPYVHADVSATDDVESVLTKITNRTQSAVVQMRGHIDKAQLQRAVDALSGALRIEFYGMGNSGITAQDGAHKFFRLGISSVAYSDPTIHSVAASMLSKRDALVVISNAGRTKALNESVAIAKRAGARIIAITAPASPLAKISDILLPVQPIEDPDLYAPMTARISHLVLIDTLAVCVALTKGPAMQRSLQSYKDILSEKHIKPK
jgi:RpiR family transcriptional regulator, carbohydrate utilization regulator